MSVILIQPDGLLRCPVSGKELLPKCCIRARGDSLSDVLHQPLQKTKIVYGGQTIGEEFLTFEQMVKVRR
jgi:hypothetical protein